MMDRFNLSFAGRKRLWGYGFLMPSLLLVVVIFVYPLYIALKTSFYKVPIYQPVLTGAPSLLNYQKLFHSPAFWRTLSNTAVYAVSVTFLSFAVGLAIALLLQRKFAGRKIGRVLVLLPWVIPVAAASLIWMWIFDPQIGIMNYFLNVLGLSPMQWLLRPHSAMIGLVIVGVWKEYPFFTIMSLAGMQLVPKQLYDAAKIDGAGAIRQFQTVTFPALRSVLAIALTLSALMSFRQYALIAVLTGGGPAGSTETLALAIYKNAFQYFKMGYASAMGMVSFAISLLIVVVFLSRLTKDFY